MRNTTTALETLGEWLKYLLHTQNTNNITSFIFLLQSEQTRSLTLLNTLLCPGPPKPGIFLSGCGSRAIAQQIYKAGASPLAIARGVPTPKPNQTYAVLQ